MSDQLRDDILIGDPAAEVAAPEVMPEQQRKLEAEKLERSLFHFAHEIIKDIESPLDRIKAYRKLAVSEGEESPAWQSAVTEIEMLEGENADWYEAEAYRELANAQGVDSRFWKNAVESAVEHPVPSHRVILLARVAMQQGPNSGALDIAHQELGNIEEPYEQAVAAAAYVSECQNIAVNEGIESAFWEHAARGILFNPDAPLRADQARDLAANYRAVSQAAQVTPQTN